MTIRRYTTNKTHNRLSSVAHVHIPVSNFSHCIVYQSWFRLTLRLRNYLGKFVIATDSRRTPSYLGLQGLCTGHLTVPNHGSAIILDSMLH